MDDEFDYRRMVDEATEAAAARVRAGVLAPGGVTRPSRRGLAQTDYPPLRPTFQAAPPPPDDINYFRGRELVLPGVQNYPFVFSPERDKQLNEALKDYWIPDTSSPQSMGFWAAGLPGPMKIGTRAAAGAAGYVLEPTPAEAGPKEVVKKLGKAAADIVDTTPLPKRDKAFFEAPKPDAPFPQYAEEYPAVGPPTMRPKTKKDPVTGEKVEIPGMFYPEKTLTPEAEQFSKVRAKEWKDMQKGYTPYFDPAERSYVDPSKYPKPNVDTLDVIPPGTTGPSVAAAHRYESYAGAPETLQRLKDAFARGQQLGNAEDWYAMAQLEKEYIKELGAKAGRKAFLDEFAVPMAATTSGNNPAANFAMSHWLERQRKLGRSTDIVAHQTPVTVGGRFGQTNIDDYNAVRARGGYAGLGEDQPKMHNFSRSFIGDLSQAVIDEQMAGGMLKGLSETEIANMRKNAFGMLERQDGHLARVVGLEPGQ